jgi:hypothetical protein
MNGVRSELRYPSTWDFASPTWCHYRGRRTAHRTATLLFPSLMGQREPRRSLLFGSVLSLGVDGRSVACRP